MDIYDFTQALWRRKWLLLGGFALLISFVVAISVDFSDGASLRSNVRYEATVQMAVVPDGFESLTQDLGANPLAGPARMFASLLSSPQAVLEIEEQQAVSILGLEVGASGRDRFFSATVLSDTPDGAVVAALGSFRWLEQRISEPILSTFVPTTTIPPSLLDAEGRFRTVVGFDLDHVLASDTEGLWLVASTEFGEDFAFRLTDAAEDTSLEYSSLVSPGAAMSLVLEDAVGKRLDAVVVALPPLPSEEASSYDLIVDIDRGFVRGEADSPQLDANRVRLNWDPVTAQAGQVDVNQLSEVSVLLLTDVPIPMSIGGRRTPLLIVAFMTAGTIALIVFAVAVDSWIQERRRRENISSEVNPHAVPRPIPLSGDEAPDDRRQAEF